MPPIRWKNRRARQSCRTRIRAAAHAKLIQSMSRDFSWQRQVDGMIVTRRDPAGVAVVIRIATGGIVAAAPQPRAVANTMSIARVVFRLRELEIRTKLPLEYSTSTFMLRLLPVAGIYAWSCFF